MQVDAHLDGLARPELLRVAHEYMLFGLIVNRAMLPQVLLHGGTLDDLNATAIDEWMGSSPTYTHRMRTLMGIRGDNVEAIMKALQLDVGFVHQYMDVAYKLVDDSYGEFWLNHCGALLDAEPHGEAHVFGMCHTIEDPTFDATALATNPRARIRPIHRPPRLPADRHPHCHWTITIDAANEPVGPVSITDAIARLPLASLENARTEDPAGSDSGMVDYTGPFEPTFRLGDLSTPTLAAVTREFQMQTQLLICSGELALRERFGDESGLAMIESTWVGASWIASERLAATLETEDRARRVARVLALTPALPPGYARDIDHDENRVRMTLTPRVAGLHSATHPGCVGLLARGNTRGIDATVHALEPHAAISSDTSGDAVAVDITLDAVGAPVPEPSEVPLMRIGMVSSWEFAISDASHRA
jgi:hypothetical protein